MAKDFPCPACGFVVFVEPPGSYDICEMCGWEDDHVQLIYPGLRGGANQESLAEKQATWVKRYPVGVREANSLTRDPEWRPLTADETRSRPGEPKSGPDYFEAAKAEAPAYYWRARK